MVLVNLLIFLLLFAGHCEVLAAGVNRLHSRPIHPDILRVFRKIHSAILVTFPFVLLIFVGFRGPALLRGGSWSELPLGWAIYLGICAIGTVSLAVSMVRWVTRTRPQPQVSNHSQLIDVAQRLGRRPAGHGEHERLLNVPGNQCFKLEISEKEYRLPRVPAAWDGLSIVHITDVHFEGAIDRPYFEEVCRIANEMRGDVIVFTGDLVDEVERIDWVPSTFGQLSAPLGCWFILGNHDWTRSPEASRTALTSLGWKDVGSTVATFEHRGHTMAIGGLELPWMGTYPDFSKAPTDAFRLLLSHTPDNIAWARENRADMMLSGHNHGGQVLLPVIGPVYAPSRYGIRYAGGPHWEDPTLLYVSRGISAMQPLRINCPPELTKLILRSPSTHG